MKIFISVDLEGINGVSKFSHTTQEDPIKYAQTMEQLYRELNCIISTARSNGVKHITINDSHGNMLNLDHSKIVGFNEIISGKPRSVSMMYGIDESYQGMILLGYHAKAGTQNACLAHTFNENFLEVSINDVKVGEAYLNTLYASLFNVPIIMATGDDKFCYEVQNEVGDTPTVEVKKSITTTSCIAKSNDIVLKNIEETMTKSLNNPTRWIINHEEGPYTLKIKLSSAIMADLAELVPCFKRNDTYTIEFTHTDYTKVYNSIQVISIISNTAKNYL